MSKNTKMQYISLFIVAVIIFLSSWIALHIVKVVLGNTPVWIFAIFISLWCTLVAYEKSKEKKGMFK